jgi:hypothetical protein
MFSLAAYLLVNPVAGLASLTLAKGCCNEVFGNSRFGLRYCLMPACGFFPSAPPIYLSPFTSCKASNLDTWVTQRTDPLGNTFGQTHFPGNFTEPGGSRLCDGRIQAKFCGARRLAEQRVRFIQAAV